MIFSGQSPKNSGLDINNIPSIRLLVVGEHTNIYLEDVEQKLNI